MLDTLTRIFTAVEFVLWAREMQRKQPGNPLHMVGEMDYVSEIHDAIEEHMTEPNFMIRKNTCPKCGCYIWAHRINDDGNTAIDKNLDCSLDIVQAQEAYDLQVRVNRQYVEANSGKS